MKEELKKEFEGFMQQEVGAEYGLEDIIGNLMPDEIIDSVISFLTKE